MGIQRKEPIRVVKDYNESVPFQPVCIDDGSRHDRVNGTPLDRLDFDASALHIGVEGRVFLTAEEGDNAPISRPRQRALHPTRGDHPGRRPGCGRAAALFQFAQQTVDTRRIVPALEEHVRRTLFHE